MICSWQENMPTDDQPPEWMWPLDHELKVHFERLAEKRRSSSGGDGGDDEFQDNELVRELIDTAEGR